MPGEKIGRHWQRQPNKTYNREALPVYYRQDKGCKHATAYLNNLYKHSVLPIQSHCLQCPFPNCLEEK